MCRGSKGDPTIIYYLWPLDLQKRLLGEDYSGGTCVSISGVLLVSFSKRLR